MIFQPNIVKVGSSSTPEGWYPPADWGWDAASALVGDGDDGIVALVACFPNLNNYSAMYAELMSGAGTVNWGDGSAVEAVSNGVQINHLFDYDNIPGSVVTGGFKVAVVHFSFTGELFRARFFQKHPSQSYDTQNWLIIKMRSTYTGHMWYYNSAGTGAEGIKMLDLFRNNGSVTGAYMLYGHNSLQRLLLNPSMISSGADLNSAFRATSVPFDFNSYDWSNVPTLAACFYAYYGPLYNLSIAINSCNSLSSAFASIAFPAIALTNTGNVARIDLACANSRVRSFTMDDCSQVVNTTNFFSPYTELLILTGLTVGINISNGKMSATALNAFFTSLGTANGAQTITVTGNPGAATCDTSIATAKGFTVVT